MTVEDNFEALLVRHSVSRRIEDSFAADRTNTFLISTAMTVFGLILCHCLLTSFAFSLIRLEPVLRTSWPGQKLVFTNLPAPLLHATGG